MKQKQEDRLDCLLNEKRFRSYGQSFNVTFIAQLNGCPFRTIFFVSTDRARACLSSLPL